MVHVRDLATGEEHAFDPDTGERCNLLTFGATDDRVVLEPVLRHLRRRRPRRPGADPHHGRRPGGHPPGQRSLEGWLPAGSDVVNVTVFGEAGDDRTGTYVYDLATDRFLRVSDAISSAGLAGATGHERQFLWHTPVNDGHGATQWLGELR